MACKPDCQIQVGGFKDDSKRDTDIEQPYGLCWRGRGWQDLGEWHGNMCNIMYEKKKDCSLLNTFLVGVFLCVCMYVYR